MQQTAVKKIARGKHVLRWALWAVANTTLGQLENSIVIRQGQPKLPPIFIVGPARSGTTLIYQALVYSLHVSYLSNAVVLFPMSPSIIAKFLSYVNGCDAPRVFDSRYGKTSGWRSPAQGYQVWNRWFPKEGEGTRKLDWTDDERKKLAGTISFIEKSYSAPFVNKWPGFSVNILQLLDALPKALFIRVQRDPLQNAQSILMGRYELTGNPYVSISRVPKGYENYINGNYIEQVCAYLLGTEEQLNQDTKILGERRVFTINYDDFCQTPQEKIENIRDWYYRLTGYELEVRNDDIPSIFTASKTQKVSSEEVDALKACLDKMSSEFDDKDY